MENRLSYSEWGKYFSVNWKESKGFGTSRKIKVIKIKHNGKNETLLKIDYCIVNEATILALIEKKAKAIAFVTSRKMKVIKELNPMGKMKHHGK